MCRLLSRLASVGEARGDVLQGGRTVCGAGWCAGSSYRWVSTPAELRRNTARRTDPGGRCHGAGQQDGAVLARAPGAVLEPGLLTLCMERWILINFQQTSSTGLGTKGNVMSANDKLETGERVESFQAERLT